MIGAALKTTVKQTAAGLLDLVYPPRCLVCERPGAPVVCDACAAAFAPVPEPGCPVCGRPQEGDECRLCALAAESGGWGFDAARGAAVYSGPMRHAVHRLKYGGAENLGEPLGAFLANRLVADGLLPDAGRIQGVVAVPMHTGRERRRGYNQARLIAAPVAAMLGVPLVDARAVTRTRKTAAQVGLSPDARRRNLDAGAFAVGEPAAVAGRHLLLVDDVFTTGTTASACAAALRAAGAASVTAATLAAGG
jgi:ComF family protein